MTQTISISHPDGTTREVNLGRLLGYPAGYNRTALHEDERWMREVVSKRVKANDNQILIDITLYKNCACEWCERTTDVVSIKTKGLWQSFFKSVGWHSQGEWSVCGNYDCLI